MNRDLLKAEVAKYISHRKTERGMYEEHSAVRKEHAEKIQSWSKDKVEGLDEEGLYSFIAPLWAMLIWGNKQYVVDKLVTQNGIQALQAELAELIWGEPDIADRWDRFKARIKGMGPAMMSEILCHMHPTKCAIWNRRARAGLSYLGVPDLPKYDYQLTGERYVELTREMQSIASELKAQGLADADLLTVDYFIWDKLQNETEPDGPNGQGAKTKPTIKGAGKKDGSDFVHNEVRDKIAEIGLWLGFKSSVETKVADGSKVDAIWQSTIGNMGTVIYVFEVQTKGSIDSALLNLLKSLNNSAVQGVVVVSDGSQLEKIKKHAAGVSGLSGKLKYWDYEEVLTVHSALERVNESINALGLVPQGFAL